MDDYQRRKQARREMYERQLKNKGTGRKIDCLACAGSGYYDNHGSPECGSCEGKGWEWEQIYPQPVAEPEIDVNSLTRSQRKRLSK